MVRRCTICDRSDVCGSGRGDMRALLGARILEKEILEGIRGALNDITVGKLSLKEQPKTQNF